MVNAGIPFSAIILGGCGVILTKEKTQQNHPVGKASDARIARSSRLPGIRAASRPDRRGFQAESRLVRLTAPIPAVPGVFTAGLSATTQPAPHRDIADQ